MAIGSVPLRSEGETWAGALPEEPGPDFVRVRRRVLRTFAGVGVVLGVAVLGIELVVGAFLAGFDAAALEAIPRQWHVLAVVMNLACFGATRALQWYAWGAVGLGLCAGLLRVAERWSWQRSLRVVLVLGVPLAAAHQAVLLALFAALPATRTGIYPRGYDPYTTTALVQGYFSEYFTYLLVAGFGLSLVYFARYHERKRQAAVLAAQLVEARLEALKMQVHPHFLFNALNAIVALVRRQDTRTAARMLTRLGELLCRSLDDTGRLWVSLAEELDFVRRYVELEQMRLGDRLDVTWDVAPGAADARVPGFLLQPLVENAVRHGVAVRAAGGWLAVRARREGDRLVLVVEDDGPGFGAAGAGGTGVGLANVRGRLAHTYGDAARLRCEDGPAGGARVTVVLPFELLAASLASAPGASAPGAPRVAAHVAP